MANYSNEDCGARIRRLRKEAGIKTIEAFAEKIAEKTGVQPSSQKISDYEKGKYSVPYETLIVIADILHVTVDYLLGVSNDPNPQAAEASAYTGLSPQALRVLHDTTAAMPGAVGLLNDLILDPSFAFAFYGLKLLQAQADAIEGIDISVPQIQDQMIMRSKHEIRLARSVQKQYGVSVILKGLEALKYQETRSINELHEIITRICRTRRAAELWAKKQSEAKKEFLSRTDTKNGGE